ncbi:MAG: hypothetical protein KH068_08065, partial [Prevotella sp.]|nr:hypothetical protein [Prevotella sp.]MBS7208386.1 hypothetical protein [Prevotella sp.]
IDLVKDLDTSRQTKNLNKLLIRILLHLQVEFSIFVVLLLRFKAIAVPLLLDNKKERLLMVFIQSGNR